MIMDLVQLACCSYIIIDTVVQSLDDKFTIHPKIKRFMHRHFTTTKTRIWRSKSDPAESVIPSALVLSDRSMPETSALAKKLAKKRDSPKLKKEGDTPFPAHNRPTNVECRAARDSLALLHGEPIRQELKYGGEPGKQQRCILDSLASGGTQNMLCNPPYFLVFVLDMDLQSESEVLSQVQTILSQNTTDINSHRTFTNLKAKFAQWDDVLSAPTDEVEAAIKLGGLAAIKTARIKEILRRLREERGECSLEHLRSKSDEEIKAHLLQYNGVGPKTAACVLMFAMSRFEFPVDTHVWRIAKNLSWVPGKASREEAYEHLNCRIPDEIKYDLHVLMVEHGKRCSRCAKNNRPRKESLGPCPLNNISTSTNQGEKPSAKRAAENALKELSADDLLEHGGYFENKMVKSEDGMKEEGPVKRPAESKKKEVKLEDTKIGIKREFQDEVSEEVYEHKHSKFKVKEEEEDLQLV